MAGYFSQIYFLFLFLPLGQVPQLAYHTCYTLVSNGKNSQVFEPACHFLNFDAGSGRESGQCAASVGFKGSEIPNLICSSEELEAFSEELQKKLDLVEPLSTEGDPTTSGAVDVGGFFRLAQESLQSFFKMLIESLPEEWQPHTIWHDNLRMLAVMSTVEVVLLVAWVLKIFNKVDTGLSLIEEERKGLLEKLKAGDKLRTKLEEHIKIVELDCEFLVGERDYYKIHIQDVQAQLEVITSQCQEKANALQQKLVQEPLEQCDKKARAGPKTSKQKAKDLKEKKSKIESMLYNELKACAAERAILADIQETSHLHEQLMKISATLADVQGLLSVSSTSRPDQQIPPAVEDVSAPKTPSCGIYGSIKSTVAALEKDNKLCTDRLLAEEKKCQKLEEQVALLEQDQAALIVEKTQLEKLMGDLVAELKHMSNLCLRKDNALRQALAQDGLGARNPKLRSGLLKLPPEDKYVSKKTERSSSGASSKG